MTGEWGGAGHSEKGGLVTAEGQGVPCGCGSEGPGGSERKGPAESAFRRTHRLWGRRHGGGRGLTL